MIHYFAIIAVIGILVFVHEMGHFLAAKFFGVRVERFSIGFPPRLFGFKKGDTDYCVSAIPLGGYVKLSGMIDESLDESTLTGAPYEFMSKPTYQKIIIICAGVIMNFVTAVAILAGFLWMFGEAVIPTTRIDVIGESGFAQSAGLERGDRILSVNGQPVAHWKDIEQKIFANIGSDLDLQVERRDGVKEVHVAWNEANLKSIENLNIAPLLPAMVGDVLPDSPALSAGLEKGDQILSIDGTPVNDWNAMTAIVREHPGQSLVFQILRDADTLRLSITPEAVSTVGQDSVAATAGRIGISYYFERHQVGFFASLSQGFSQALFIGELNIRGFGLVLFGKAPAKDMVAGPLRIAKIATDSSRIGLSSLIMLIAHLSIVLAFVNILPIPALDGGHLAMIVIEGIIKRPLSVKLKVRVQQVGMALLLALILLVTYNDLRYLITSFFHGG